MIRKNLPVFIMLVAGLLTCIFTYVRQDPLLQRLLTLLAVLVIFYVMGNAICAVLNYFDRQNEQRLSEEMIEKDMEEAVEEETQTPQQEQG